MKSTSLGRVVLIVVGLVAAAAIGLFIREVARARSRPVVWRMKSEIMQLALALEQCRNELGHGQYPPGATDEAETVKQFLAKAFPGYEGGLPEKYKNFDAASSLVFWLGGMTDRDGKMIGFSADPKNPLDTKNQPRLGPFFDFDPTTP